MAYYHGRGYKLNRFEQFEVAGDSKGLKKKPVQRPKEDFGAGIAAQFGLVKKSAPGGVRKSGDERVKKKKRLPSEDEEEEEDSDSSGKKAPPDRNRLFAPDKAQLKKKKELERKKSLKKAASMKEVNLGLAGQFDNDESHRQSDDNRMGKKLSKKKTKSRDDVRAKAIRRRSFSSPNEEDSGNSDDDDDDDDDSGRTITYKRTASEELIARDKVRKHYEEMILEKKKKKRERKALENNGHLGQKHKSKPGRTTSRSVSSDNEESDEEEDEEDEEDEREERYKRTTSEEPVMRQKSRKHRGEVVNPEKKKKRRDSCASEEEASPYNEKRKEKHTAVSAKEVEAEKLQKQKTFIIPKVAKNGTSSNEKSKQTSNGASTVDREKFNKILKNVARELKSGKTSTETSAVPVAVPSINKSSVNIKSEPVDEVMEITQNISQEYTNIRNKSRLKSSQVIKNVSSTPSLSNSPVKVSGVTNEQRKALLKGGNDKRFAINLDVEIKSEPEDNDVPSKSTSDNTNSFKSSNASSAKDGKTVSSVSVESSDEKSASSLIDEYVADSEKKEPCVRVRLDNTGVVDRTKSVVKCKKGENLAQWFVGINENLGKKSTRADGSCLNYFITLNSRFKVMTETMEMSDLEVLPEEDAKESHSPIRIFTSLCKDHYEQYLDETFLSSIPELIITRLFQSTPPSQGETVVVTSSQPVTSSTN